MLTIQKAKELMKEQGMDEQTIDWTSYSDDIPLEDYLKNEYSLSLRTDEEMAQEMAAKSEGNKLHKFYNPENVEWKSICETLKSLVVIGDTRTGKTAKAYKILENFDKKIYWLKHPNVSVLNERGFIQLHNLADVEYLSDCVLVIDEPQLHINTQDKQSNMILMRLLSLCGQRDITLILITSDTRFVTKGLEAYIDVWVIKDLDFASMKRGSIAKRAVIDCSYIDVDGFSLKIEEYLFYSRKYKEYNGKHKFALPKYFDERHSKPYQLRNEPRIESRNGQK